MEKNPFFEKFGKRIPYEVPTNFFNTITEKTLHNARVRRRKAKLQNLSVWISAAAVVLIIMMFTGLNLNWFGEKPQISPIVQAEKELSQMMSAENQASFSDSSLVTSLEPVGKKQDYVLGNPEEYQEETFENLLASLTEEELQIVIGQISAEIYLNELIEE